MDSVGAKRVRQRSKFLGSTRILSAAAIAAWLVGSFALPSLAFDARLDWTAVDNVAGYRVYVRQNGQGAPLSIDVGPLQPDGGVVRHVVRDLPAGATNSFAVSAYDAIGREGDPSNELTLEDIAVASPAATETPASVPSTATPSASPTPTMPAAPPTFTTTAVPPTPTSTASVTRTFTATSTPPAPTASRTSSPSPSATRRKILGLL